MNRNKTLRPLTSLERALLGLVHGGTDTGYALVKLFETTPMGHYSASPGAIYPALKRLEARGLLKGQAQAANRGRPKRQFELTPEGHAALLDWMATPVTAEDVTWHQDDLLLRFSFMGQAGADDLARRFLADLADACSVVLSGLRAHHQGMLDAENDQSPLPTGRLALGCGIEAYRGLRRWARAALNELNTTEGGNAP